MAREIATTEGDSFPELLRWKRQRAGLTQAQLAELSGLGVRTIRNWEQGKAKPLPSLWLRLLSVVQPR